MSLQHLMWDMWIFPLNRNLSWFWCLGLEYGVGYPSALGDMFCHAASPWPAHMKDYTAYYRLWMLETHALTDSAKASDGVWEFMTSATWASKVQEAWKSPQYLMIFMQHLAQKVILTAPVHWNPEVCCKGVTSRVADQWHCEFSINKDTVVKAATSTLQGLLPFVFALCSAAG